jgi:hypothetical protein
MDIAGSGKILIGILVGLKKAQFDIDLLIISRIGVFLPSLVGNLAKIKL